MPGIKLETFAAADRTIKDQYLKHISPIAVISSDGGSDHNIAFTQTQGSLLAMVIMFELHALVATNCAPYNSAYEEVERLNSLLNLALDQTSHERTECTSKAIETAVLKCGSQKQLRAAAAGDPTGNFEKEFVGKLYTLYNYIIQLYHLHSLFLFYFQIHCISICNTSHQT